MAPSSTEGDELTEAESAALAPLGRAVSPLQSLLAEAPGPHPETGGDAAMQGYGTSSHCGGFGTHDAAAPIHTISRNQEELRLLLAASWRRCAPGGGSAVVSIETSMREIVDVPAVALKGAEAGARACIEQAAWQIELPDTFLAPLQRLDITLDASGAPPAAGPAL
jgi:hypothetical protein